MANSSNSSETTTRSSSSSAPKGGLGRGLLGRAVAVILFLGLGTFAVSQSLMGTRTTPETEDDELALVIEEESTTKNETPSGNGLQKESEQKPDDASQVTSQIKSFKSNFDIAAREKPDAAETKPRVERFNLPPAKSFQTETPVNKVPGAPIVRTASTGPPKTQSGFNPRTANPVVSTLGDVGEVAKSTTGQLGQMADAAKTSVAEKSNDILNAARNKTNELTDSAKRGLDNVVGGLDRNKPLTGQPIVRNTPQSLGGNPSNQNRSVIPVVPGRSPTTTTPNPAKSSASFDSNRSLAPLDVNDLRNSSPVAARQNTQSNLSDSRLPTRTGQTNLASQTQTQPQTQTPLPQRQFPATNPQQRNFNQNLPTNPQNNRGLVNSSPSQQGPANNSMPIRRQPQVPVRNASASRVIQPATTGVVTMPTPGEKELEGVRTATVTVQKIAPKEIQLNTPAVFELVIRNSGQITADDVRVYDQIPTGTQLLEATPQPSVNSGKDVQWHIGDLAPGQERRIKLRLKATQPGEIGSVAHVTTATQASVRTLVTKPELEITHTAPAKSLIGDNVRLDIVVTNRGNGPANRVIVQEDIPSQLEYADGFREIEYEIGTLAPGQSRKLPLILRAIDIGRLRNVINATADGGLSSQHAVDMEIVAPKLVANAAGPRKRYLRRQATHEFAVRNGGTASATNVEMTAKLPPGLKFVSTNNQGWYDQATNAVYWSLTELAAGTDASVSLTTVPTDTGNQDIEFTAVSDLKQKAVAGAPLVVEHLVDVFFDIDDVVDHIEVGSDTKYQLRIVNQGTKTATNVQLSLQFPNGIRPTTIEGGLQGQVQGTRVAFAPITSMNPGDEIKVAVNATGAAPGEHKIVANMQTDGREINVSKEETTQVYSDR